MREQRVPAERSCDLMSGGGELCLGLVHGASAAAFVGSSFRAGSTCPRVGRESGALPVRREAKEGCCPHGGSAGPCSSHLSGSADRPDSTTAMTACPAARASPGRDVDDCGQAFGQAPGGWLDSTRGNGTTTNGVEMNKYEAAMIAAKIKEVEDKVTRLEALARQMLEKARVTSSATSSPR